MCVVAQKTTQSRRTDHQKKVYLNQGLSLSEAHILYFVLPATPKAAELLLESEKVFSIFLFL